MCLEVPPCPRIYRCKGEAAGQGRRGAPGGVLLLPGVGLPPFLVGLGVEEGKTWRGGRKGGAAPPLLGVPIGSRPPPCSFIYGGRGAPLNAKLIYDILAVCGAPSTILHLDNIVAVLRRSPASVEHHHCHHAVMLTKLSLNTRLDRSSRDVIELDVC